MDVDVTTRYEDELLICCSRVSHGPQLQAQFDRLLRKPLDWQTLLDRGWWHRIRPLTYFHLRSQPAGLVPDEVLEELAGHASELAARNLRLSAMLSDVTALFEGAALRTLVFKGPTLATDAYGDLSLRECGDLDLLVHRDDVSRAIDVLKSDGFEFVSRIQQSGECDFQRNGMPLDLHWNLAPWWLNYRVNFDRLWENGVPLAKSCKFVKKLCPEDAIVVLSIHGTKHWWERLRWICDIAELVNSGSVTDWDRVLTEATYARSRRSVSLGLSLASELLSAKLPDEIKQELDQSQVIKRLTAQVRAWLEIGGNVEVSGTSRERLLFRMRVNDRLRDRVPQIVRTLMARVSRGVHWNP